jgi:hypothetical protein
VEGVQAGNYFDRKGMYTHTIPRVRLPNTAKVITKQVVTDAHVEFALFKNKNSGNAYFQGHPVHRWVSDTLRGKAYNGTYKTLQRSGAVVLETLAGKKAVDMDVFNKWDTRGHLVVINYEPVFIARDDHLAGDCWHKSYQNP